jgi:midasin (ATPase involved in ribosome maturation)
MCYFLFAVPLVMLFCILQVLSRAFRNRFVELHFDEIASCELEEILQKRCQLPQSYSRILVQVMTELQVCFDVYLINFGRLFWPTFRI